jgi:hypothetical protein
MGSEMTRTVESQLNMENWKITERKGHHKPNSQRYPNHCGCHASTDGGYAYRDIVVKSTADTKWNTIRFYHQSPVVKKNRDTIKVDTHGYGLNSTTRQRINKELPTGIMLRQKDFELKVEVNGELKDVGRKFKADPTTKMLKV